MIFFPPILPIFSLLLKKKNLFLFESPVFKLVFSITEHSYSCLDIYASAKYVLSFPSLMSYTLTDSAMHRAYFSLNAHKTEF